MTYEKGAKWLEQAGFTLIDRNTHRWITTMPGRASVVEVWYVWGLSGKPWGARIGLSVGEGATPASALKRMTKAEHDRVLDSLAVCGYIDGLTP